MGHQCNVKIKDPFICESLGSLVLLRSKCISEPNLVFIYIIYRGISAEACKNAGGAFYQTPCVTLKETVVSRPSRFDLELPFGGSCDNDMQCLYTSYVSALPDHQDFSFKNITRDECVKFCQSLPDYSSQVGLQIDQTCTCVYQNNKLPSRELLPVYARASLPPFILTNQIGMSLGIRPNIECDSSDDLIIESQVSDLHTMDEWSMEVSRKSGRDLSSSRASFSMHERSWSSVDESSSHTNTSKCLSLLKFCHCLYLTFSFLLNADSASLPRLNFKLQWMLALPQIIGHLLILTTQLSVSRRRLPTVGL